MTIEELYKIYLQNPNITTDSRNCPKHSIFFGIKGEHFDGTLYGDKALENGAALAVTENSLETMQALANMHVRRLKDKGLIVIGITGTNGKTTTKELVSAVLAKKYNVLYTQGNFNNHLGVPLTLLRLREEHQIAVIEMGANHPGEIRELVNIVEPQFGLISTVGRAHLEGFGSFEGVVKTKGELYDFLRANGGKIFLNAENEHLVGISEGIEKIEYHPSQHIEKVVNDLKDSKDLKGPNPDFFVSFNWAGEKVHTNLIGNYNVTNLVAAATVGKYFCVSDEDIRAALSEYQPTNNRSQLTKTEHNTLIVDAYNANPTSMAAALENFRDIKAEGKMVILGSMGELGEVSHEEHVKILNLLNECGINDAWLVGEEFIKAAENPDFGISESRVSGLQDSQTPGLPDYRIFENVEAVIAELSANPLTGKTILIKGSNSQKLFKLPEHL